MPQPEKVSDTSITWSMGDLPAEPAAAEGEEPKGSSAMFGVPGLPVPDSTDALTVTLNVTGVIEGVPCPTPTPTPTPTESPTATPTARPTEDADGVEDTDPPSEKQKPGALPDTGC